MIHYLVQSFCNKAFKNDHLWNNFKTLTSTSNRCLSETITDQTIMFDSNTKLTKLSNSYNRSEGTIRRYTETQ